MIKISPSILSADFARLGEEAARMEHAGADLLHVDVMDGHFVPNLTFGPSAVRALRGCARLPLDVHLMIDAPERFVDAFARAGADLLTVHLEAVGDRAADVLRQIRAAGMKPSVSIKPGTPARALFPLLKLVDMVLVMTVEPGFGGQKLIESTLPKIGELRAQCAQQGVQPDIEVDGGINLSNIGRVAALGANVFVAGSAVFGAPDAARRVTELRRAAEAGLA